MKRSRLFAFDSVVPLLGLLSKRETTIGVPQSEIRNGGPPSALAELLDDAVVPERLADHGNYPPDVRLC